MDGLFIFAVLDTTKAPFYKWFVGGETNACYNAVDRNVAEHRGDQVAVVYESAITGGYKRKGGLAYVTMHSHLHHCR